MGAFNSPTGVILDHGIHHHMLNFGESSPAGVWGSSTVVIVEKTQRKSVLRVDPEMDISLPKYVWHWPHPVSGPRLTLVLSGHGWFVTQDRR